MHAWVRSVGKVFVGQDGQPEKLVNLFKDITDRRRQTEAIETLARFCQSQNGNFNRARWFGYINGTCGKNGGAVKGEQ